MKAMFVNCPESKLLKNLHWTKSAPDTIQDYAIQELSDAYTNAFNRHQKNVTAGTPTIFPHLKACLPAGKRGLHGCITIGKANFNKSKGN